MAKPFYWNELNTLDFASLSEDRTIAVLPIASTEQHGPHLPVATDVAIANGMLAELKVLRPDDIDFLVLPTQEIGKANEHVYGPGTLSLGPEILIQTWTAIGTKVAEAGVRKMVIVNSHGGNVDIMSIVARELRVRHRMAVVSTQWGRFGNPEGMISEHEQKFGIHGGDVETSLMLHFRPDLVRMEHSQNFTSKAEWMKEQSRLLQPLPPHSLAWIAHDLNPHGVVGNAAAGTAAKGAAICRHQVTGFIELLRDLSDYPLDNLYVK
ncbi:creatinine amidohydrolase [Agrobacterium tumefaciens]|uniref:Creatinine amidohydrolase n=1 Tax=Agrobacterium radiobacter TaxID=362 RepID=A0ABR6JE14_AGRRD|nr:MULTISPECIES: creatininase family protein [Agrobacterium tumefaciens complex]MBB4321208.1 creatinine amidohydrolase [Agrobacterium radiobacter]MBB4338248.1 creatinine amidohydrolase [Agrobacterium radiobacter]MBB4493136.1 creatinine amidohydrolase [Agrobacterium radiobacter]MBB4498409.1 creatinine amidohydrolase [Agrobacterium radiobacter]MBB4503892.1 creatinine amidohydrolase [Agrobacterium radiobacter]